MMASASSFVMNRPGITSTGNPAKSGTNALMLVERDADAFSAAADGNALPALARLYAFCQSMPEVRIVAALLAISPVVVKLDAPLCKVLLYMLLERKASMITCKSNHDNIFFT